MATIKLDFDIDDKKLNDLISKKKKVQLELEPAKGAKGGLGEEFAINIKENVSRKTRAHANKLETTLTSDISTLFGNLAGIFKNKVFLSILSTVSKFAVGFGAISTAGVIYAGRQLSNAFTSTATSFEALRSTMTNVPDLSGYADIKDIITSTSEKYGIPFKDIASAVENALPAMRDRSVGAIRNTAEIFGQLRYLENLQPEELMSLAELSTVTQKPLEDIAQLYNVLTDNVGLQSRQIVTFLRRTYSSFTGSLEEMMAALEYIMVNITPDPREAIRIVKEGSEALAKVDFSKGFDINKLSDEAKTMLSMYQSYDYAAMAEKYFNPGTLIKSYEDLMSLPASKIEQFGKKASAKMNTELMSFVENNFSKVEEIYKGIDISAKKYFGDYAPLVKPLFISPETGMPTTLTAMIPIIEKLTGLQVTAESILEVLKSASDTGSKAIDIGEWMLRTGEKIFNSFGTYNKYSPIGGMP